ncbi:MAG: arginyltransferase [Planctomycetaceae bacterium]
MADELDSKFAGDEQPQRGELIMLGSESSCGYLSGRMSQMEYRFAFSLTDRHYEQLLERGWRRFGRMIFRPKCRTCRECRSLRIVLDRFQPSKSQRRCRTRNRAIQVEIGPPDVTDEHLSLYNRYHLDMHRRRNWPFRMITRDEYSESFLEGRFPFSREFRYLLNGQLVAIGIVDMTESAMSSIYFFHDPELRHAGLGTYSVLSEIAEGQRTARHRLYLGYYIRECGSMNYKNRFAPHEILRDYVGDDELPLWEVP